VHAFTLGADTPQHNSMATNHVAIHVYYAINDIADAKMA
jgi:hypothetical protein